MWRQTDVCLEFMEADEGTHGAIPDPPFAQNNAFRSLNTTCCMQIILKEAAPIPKHSSSSIGRTQNREPQASDSRRNRNQPSTGIRSKMVRGKNPTGGALQGLMFRLFQARR